MESRTHRILEASAGTGKTYSISELVIDKILSKVPITGILVMTFTEAAAEELRNRIRNRIKKELDENADENSKALLRAALADFDQAAICTIHGFCKKILESYAFECRLCFNMAVNNISKVYEDAFYEQLYKNADVLSSAIELAGDSVHGEEYYKNTCIKIAREIHEDDKISPECDVPDRIAEEIEAISREILPLDKDFTKKLAEDLEAKKIHHSTKSSLLRLLEKLGDILESSHDFVSLARNLGRLTKDDIEKIELNKGSFLPDDFKDNILDILSKNNIPYYLKGKFIKDTSEIAKKTNKKLLQFTYNDLIEIVADRVSEENSPLLRELRKKYKIGIIDEFQDTNPLQWTIVKKIFTLPDILDERHIITAGDPKQSIYSFQGANMETYIGAIKSIEEDSNITDLDTNYRTHKHLVGIFNRIFEHKDSLENSVFERVKKSGVEYEISNINWFQKETYKPIFPIPENHKDYPKVNRDLSSGYNHLTLVTFDKDLKDKYKVQRDYAYFIGREIKRFIKNSPYEGFALSDVFVLVRNHNEADIIENVFKEMCVPYTFYKKKGIYTSEESNNLYYTLRAVAYPNKSRYLKEALLTDFFNMSISDLYNTEVLENEKITSMFSKWRDLKTISNIPKLIRDIYSSTGILERSLGKDLGGERAYANYMQIARILENYALSERRDIHDVLDFFKTLRDSRQEEAEDDTEELDTEKDKVKIMTMHASKGLESGIVFIAGGWKAPSNKIKYYIHSYSDHKEYDLDKSQGDFYKKNELAEQKRLFYVAMTRAKFMLYMPSVPENLKDIPLKRVVLRGISHRNLEENPYVKFIDAKDGLAAEDNAAYNSSAESCEFPLAEEDFGIISNPPEIKDHSLKGVDMVSFSSMSRGMESGEDLELQDMSVSKVEEALEEPEDIWDIPEDTVMLPKGTQTGLMLHEIFEQIDYEKVMSYKSFHDFREDAISSKENLINQIFSKYSTYFPKDMEENFRENTYKVIWNTLHTKLDFADIAIGDIKYKLCELKFTSPYKRIVNGSEKEDFITGIIDMIFKVGERYYILDWKSNISSTGRYETEDIEEIMALHNYHFQAEIYGDGLKRWLSGINISEEKYGGYVYVFLRGAEISSRAELCVRMF